MKFVTRFLILALLLCGLNAFAAGNIITATVTLTNSAFGTSNYMTLTVNGDTRTWTNSVQVPATQILTNTTPQGSTTNLFVQVSDFPFANVSLTYSATNAIALKGIPGLAMNVTIVGASSPTWAFVTFTTNYLTNAYVVRVPLTIEQPNPQTNIASLLVSGIDSFATNSFAPNDVALSNYVALSTAQSISGNKSFGGTSNYINAAFLNNSTSTNGVNYGSAFSSPGPALPSDQFGSGASVTAAHSIAAGSQSVAGGDSSSAFGYTAHASGINSTAIGTAASATGTNSITLGVSASATATNSIAIGVAASATFSNSVAIGTGAATTAPAQMMLGAPGVTVVANNYLSVLGGATFAQGITNTFFNSTNNFPSGSDISFGRFPITTLANGNNAAVPVGTNVYVEVSGPSGAFTINGINASPNRDGKLLILKNATGQTMTVANQSGTDPTAANRILTGFTADQSYTNNPGMVTLIYDGSISRWIVVSHN